MKLSVALFFAGLFGALAVVFILLSFGTDYWLLASESCRPPSDNDRTAAERGDMPEQNVTSGVALYHEGFFWRCSFAGDVQEEDLLWALWFTNQPHSKVCMHSYLFPFPVSHHTHNATAYESAIIYRGFWSIFMLIGVAAVVLAGFFIICAAPFASHCLYKTGGGFFLASGFFLLCVVVMYVLWIEVLDAVDVYVNYQRSNVCPDFHLTLYYGLSFMFAPVGIFFSLLAGLLFLLIGRTVKIHYH
ncbi:transmembrane protein 182 isoform X1 [Phyllopteryx taeniolatus]|uniref:transmembrane protein 182 isoform X1 n=1 Tax=Phyllopteryx taeniolatus TaxID=161469 RepID=UPI002AD33AB9|nr:transmembrane protein 182 isoform X1 [Phyllopteryx taeniolatus]XP_061648920.1 transmembrane protein 182 isoform X1 [Phyllopteryx taeniolatus]